MESVKKEEDMSAKKIKTLKSEVARLQKAVKELASFRASF